ncbi:MAG: putative transcriptional regulator [Candidatus Azotimanducaceae bacterium]|jgi:putative transcriptional regulator
MVQSFKNQFLIALNALKGDYFEDTISLIIDHNEEGTFGLVINRPVTSNIDGLFEQLSRPINCPVLEGGPVDQSRVFFLHPIGPSFDATMDIGSDIALTTSPDILTAMENGNAPDNLIAVLGYSGWGAAQLEQELADNTWLMTPSSQDIVFFTPDDQKANKAALSLGVDLNLMPTIAGHD